jgi:cell wall assembly regulator SMI1
VNGSGEEKHAVKTLLQKLFSILEQQTGLNPLPFNAGCSAAQITEAERLFSVELPDDYKAFLRHCNGQNDDFLLTFPPDQLVFLSLAEAMRLWQDLTTVPDDQFFDTFEAGGRTRNVVQHYRRIPIAHNESGGAYLQVDYIPGPNGKEQQLVFNINEVDNVVIENDFTSLITSYVLLLGKGVVKVKKQPPEFGEGYWFVSAQDEPLDWATYKRVKDELDSHQP